MVIIVHHLRVLDLPGWYLELLKLPPGYCSTRRNSRLFKLQQPSIQNFNAADPTPVDSDTKNSQRKILKLEYPALVRIGRTIK